MTIRITGMSLAVQNAEKELDAQVRRAVLAMENVGEDISGVIKDEIEDSGGVDTGAFVASISQKTETNKSEVSVSVFSNEIHSLYYEFGRRSGGKPPPLQALVSWASRHNFFSVLKVNSSIDSYEKELHTAFAILKNKKTTRKNKLKKKKPFDPVVLDLVRLISLQRSIARNGTKGRFVFTKTLEKEQKNIQKYFLNYFNI